MWKLTITYKCDECDPECVPTFLYGVKQTGGRANYLLNSSGNLPIVGTQPSPSLIM